MRKAISRIVAFAIAGAALIGPIGLMGGNTYTNPIVHADYSDPDVVAAPDGSGFYMTASSFNCAPGLPILHSTDLVNWEIVNYALEQVPPADFYSAAPRHGKGVWAPSIRCHDGVYYIYWGDPDFGIFMTRTDNPLGRWSEPVLVKAGRGMIDPTPLWDDDGRVYLVHAWAGSRAGFNSVLTVVELNDDGTAAIASPVMVYDGNDGVNHTVEGPKFYKRNGYYYILAPAGGVVGGWQIALRSRSVYGPYEVRTVMAQGDTSINGPHQGGWVDTPDGESWFIHFQDKGLYGRVLHLNPMKWVGDWPVIGNDADGDGCGEPVDVWQKPRMGATAAVASIADSDEFNSPRLGLQWEWQANYRDTFGFPTAQGFFRLYSHRRQPDDVNLWNVPNVLLQKFPALAFSATAKVRVSAKDGSDGVSSGLVVMGIDYGCLSVTQRSGEYVLQQVVCSDAEHGGAERRTDLARLATRRYQAGARPNCECSVWLRVSVAAGGECRFSYSADGRKFIPVGESFMAAPGKWIGAKVGLFSTAPVGAECGWMDIDRFIVEK